jgi:hypothetical protein
MGQRFSPLTRFGKPAPAALGDSLSSVGPG